MKQHGFERYIGVDYSGAATPTSRLAGLRVAVAAPGGEPELVGPEPPARNWTRKGLARWLLERILGHEPVLVGIDHAFSFPLSYFERYGLETWEDFLADFCRYWPTGGDHAAVDAVRSGAIWQLPGQDPPPGERIGDNAELRLAERWTSSAKSVFLFDVQGSVAKSSHAGIPWLRFLRERAGNRLFCWPFDGWEPPPGRSVIAEVYPSILRKRYPREGRTVDEHDAYAVARWLEEADRRGILGRYWDPPLTPAERRTADREGWILGIG